MPTTRSPWQTCGKRRFLSLSDPNIWTILIGPTELSKTGKATAEEIFALPPKKILKATQVLFFALHVQFFNHSDRTRVGHAVASKLAGDVDSKETLNKSLNNVRGTHTREIPLTQTS